MTMSMSVNVNMKMHMNMIMNMEIYMNMNKNKRTYLKANFVLLDIGLFVIVEVRYWNGDAFSPTIFFSKIRLKCPNQMSEMADIVSNVGNKKCIKNDKHVIVYISFVLFF
jgi:hypothetical protein